MSLQRAFLWLGISITLLLASGVYSLYIWHTVFPNANKKRRQKLLQELGISQDDNDRVIAGLFHPYCNAGGGGERVLWTAIACLQREEPKVICVVYTGDVDTSKQEIINKVQARFSIKLDPARMHFVYLKKRYLVEDATWKHFTLIGQSIGSVFLGYEAIRKLSPDAFIDTMGYAFTFPLVKLLCRIPVGAYVHYPTISTNMLQRVRNRATGHTNTTAVSKSYVLSHGKLLYYQVFAKLYAFCLRQADYVMVNSSWTKGHVDGLLRMPMFTSLSGGRHNTLTAKTVFPPCDTDSLNELPLEGRQNIILSLAQFRPEKEHATQLQFYKAFCDTAGKQVADSWKLVMAGSVRNKGDEDRVEGLRRLAVELGVANYVEFAINKPFPELLGLFGRASVGLSTMVDEHFGINVVEFMTAGLIPLVHASGGPLLDIVVPSGDQITGFHASDPTEFAKQMIQITCLSLAEDQAIRRAARQSASIRFSEERFDEGWMSAWKDLVRKLGQ